MAKALIEDLCTKTDFFGRTMRGKTCPSCKIKYRAIRLTTGDTEECPKCANGEYNDTRDG